MNTCLGCQSLLPGNWELVICEECLPIGQRLRMSLCIQSTGNEEQDEAHHKSAVISSLRIERGFCPNGCGKMDGNTCPKCNFQMILRTF
jgi:hypothetical protein